MDGGVYGRETGKGAAKAEEGGESMDIGQPEAGDQGSMGHGGETGRRPATCSVSSKSSASCGWCYYYGHKQGTIHTGLPNWKRDVVDKRPEPASVGIHMGISQDTEKLQIWFRPSQ